MDEDVGVGEDSNTRRRERGSRTGCAMYTGGSNVHTVHSICSTQYM